MHALSSAALAMAVTRACTRGELEKCGCDRKVRGVSPEGEAGLLYEYVLSLSLTHTQKKAPESFQNKSPNKMIATCLTSHGRVPVVRMQRQPVLRRGLLPDICGRTRASQGPVGGSPAPEPPQQRGRAEGWQRTPCSEVVIICKP